MNLKLIKRYKLIFILNILITLFFFLTIFSNIAYSQQINLGFDYGFLPFQYSNSFTSIKNNIYYSAFIFLELKLNENSFFSINYERSTFNIFQQNSLSFGFSYLKDFLFFNQNIKVNFSDDFKNLFPYFESQTSILLDFYPIFFFFIGLNNPLYIQPIFSSLVQLPKDDTFELFKLKSEIGFYIYQLSIGLFFEFDKILYNFDNSVNPVKYNRLLTYDLALMIKYVPTFTLFGFTFALGYSYNDLNTILNLHYIHQYLYAKAKLIFNIEHFKIEPSFGYILYSFYSSNINDISKMARLYAALSLIYIF